MSETKAAGWIGALSALAISLNVLWWTGFFDKPQPEPTPMPVWIVVLVAAIFLMVFGVGVHKVWQSWFGSNGEPNG